MARLSVPSDHPHRRDISRLENAFNAALIEALDKQKRQLMRGITTGNVSMIPAMLYDDKVTEPLRKLIEDRLIEIATSGADIGISEIQNEIARVTNG